MCAKKVNQVNMAKRISSVPEDVRLPYCEPSLHSHAFLVNRVFLFVFFVNTQVL